MSTNPIETNTVQPNGIAGGVTLSPVDQQAVMTAIDTIRQKLPFLVNLTPSERQGLAKLGDKSRAFVLKAVDVATQNPETLPGTHSIEDVRNIAEVFRGMFSIRLALQQLYKQVDDTTTKTGSDAYAVARTIYAGTKSPVAGAHLATAASNLGRRFGRKPKPAEPSTAAPSAAGSGVPGAKPETSLVPPPSSPAPHA
jgi:hypothetical protein